MIPLPIPREDEMLYGTCSRLAGMLRPRSLKGFCEAIFGPNSIAVIDTPSRLDRVAGAMPEGHPWANPDALVLRGTLLPLFLPFLPPERAGRVVAAARGAGGKSIPFATGVMASRLSQPPTLRICPICAAEDRARYGEAHWHRSHQIEGIGTCHKHGCRLQPTAVERGPRKNRHAFIPVPNNPPEPTAMASKESAALAREAHWLLNGNNARPGWEKLARAYTAALIEHRLAHPSGRLHAQQLTELFRDRHGGLLEETNCTIENVEQNWLIDMLRNRPRCPHPVQHLLVINFLGYTAQEFFEMAEKPGPPKRKPEPPPKVRKRPEINPAVLRRLWNRHDLSLRTISARLGVDPMTTKRRAALLDLPFPRQSVRPTRSKPPSAPKIPLCRR